MSRSSSRRMPALGGVALCIGLSTSACTRSTPIGPVVEVRPGAQSPHQIGRYCASDKALVAAPGEKGFLSFGPYAALPPGPYEARFDLSVRGATGSVGRVDVNAFVPGQPIRVLASTELGSDGPRQITLRFDASAEPRYEFRVSSDGQATIQLKGIVVNKMPSS